VAGREPAGEVRRILGIEPTDPDRGQRRDKRGDGRRGTPAPGERVNVVAAGSEDAGAAKERRLEGSGEVEGEPATVEPSDASAALLQGGGADEPTTLKQPDSGEPGVPAIQPSPRQRSLFSCPSSSVAGGRGASSLGACGPGWEDADFAQGRSMRIRGLSRRTNPEVLRVILPVLRSRASSLQGSGQWQPARLQRDEEMRRVATFFSSRG